MTQQPTWRPTNAPIASSRTDDIWFTDPQTGWAVNSNGQIVRTTDGGDSWTEQFHDPEVYFRCIGMATPKRGWCGTLTGGKILFDTDDGGATWRLVHTVQLMALTAVCGLAVVNDQVVYCSGTNFPNRPPVVLKTVDGGNTWASIDMRPWASMLIDIYFTDPDHGWVVGGSTPNPGPTRDNVTPVVLYTEDGGKTWVNRVATGVNFPKGEWGWKIFFLTPLIGFVSLENMLDGAILKTVDGGKTWARLRINDPQGNTNLEGVGFIDENTGWVGGWGDANFLSQATSSTEDGGTKWEDAPNVGKAINRFRFFGKPVTVGYASGQTVYRYSTLPAVTQVLLGAPNQGKLLPNLSKYYGTHNFEMIVNIPPGTRRYSVRLWTRFGELVATPLNEVDPVPGKRLIVWSRGLQGKDHLIMRVTADGVSESRLVTVEKP